MHFLVFFVILNRYRIVHTSGIFHFRFWFYKLGKNFFLSSVVDPDSNTLWIRIALKCRIRIPIDSIRIHNSAKLYVYLYATLFQTVNTSTVVPVPTVD
jgi:hypothetical protein